MMFCTWWWRSSLFTKDKILMMSRAHMHNKPVACDTDFGGGFENLIIKARNRQPFSPFNGKFSISEIDAQRLKDLMDPINQAKAGAESIGSAFNDAFSGIITGTQTAQEALGNFFKGIADSFLQMATQMIAPGTCDIDMIGLD